MIKVLHFYKDFEPLSGGGGVARYIYGLCKSLVDFGHSAHVISPIVDNNLDANFEITSGGILKVVMHAKKFDVLGLHGSRNLSVLILLCIAKIIGIRVLYIPHCYYPSKNLFKKLLKSIWDRTAEKFIYRFADQTVLLSNYWLSFAKKQNFNVSNCAVVNTSILISNEQIKQNKLLVKKKIKLSTTDQLKIISVGRLDPVKRVTDLIHAIEELGENAPDVEIVGLGPLKNDLTKTISSKLLEGKISLLGYKPDEYINKICEGNTLFVVCSEHEGMPSVLIEMIIRGVPIICTEIPGNTELLDLVQCKKYFKVGDSKTLAEHIKNSSSLKVNLCDFQTIIERCSWSNCLKNNINVFIVSKEKQRSQT